MPLIRSDLPAVEGVTTSAVVDQFGVSVQALDETGHGTVEGGVALRSGESAVDDADGVVGGQPWDAEPDRGVDGGAAEGDVRQPDDQEVFQETGFEVAEVVEVV